MRGLDPRIQVVADTASIRCGDEFPRTSLPQGNGRDRRLAEAEFRAYIKGAP